MWTCAGCRSVRDAEVHAGPATHPRMNLNPSMRAVRTKRACLYLPTCSWLDQQVRWWCCRMYGAGTGNFGCKQRHHGLVLLLLSYSIEQQWPTWLDKRPPLSQRTLAYMYRAAHRPSVAASSSSSTSSPSCAPSSCMPTRSRCGACPSDGRGGAELHQLGGACYAQLGGACGAFRGCAPPPPACCARAPPPPPPRILLARRARTASGTATQCTRRNASPPVRRTLRMTAPSGTPAACAGPRSPAVHARAHGQRGHHSRRAGTPLR
eukprot:COSAG01_NODE_15376_length_1345_cov_1.424559_2_plen_265_part_00